jgi:hypothetical protein
MTEGEQPSELTRNLKQCKKTYSVYSAITNVQIVTIENKSVYSTANHDIFMVQNVHENIISWFHLNFHK